MRSPEVVDWQLQDAEKPRAAPCFAVLAACADLTWVQHTNHRTWSCAGRASSSIQREIFFSESALRVLLRRNGKDFSVFSLVKCVPRCSEQI